MKKLIFLIIFILLSSFVIALEDYDYTGTEIPTSAVLTWSYIPSPNNNILFAGVDGGNERFYNWTDDFLTFNGLININANGSGVDTVGVGYDIGNNYIYIYDKILGKIFEYTPSLTTTGVYWTLNMSCGTGNGINNLIRLNSIFYIACGKEYYTTTDFNTPIYNYTSNISAGSRGGISYESSTGNLMVKDLNASAPYHEIFTMLYLNLTPTGFYYMNPRNYTNMFVMSTNEDRGYHYVKYGSTGISVLYYLSVQPVQVATPSSFQLGFSNSDTRNFTQFVSSYNKINVSWYDTYQNATQYLSGTVGGANSTYDSANVNIVLMSVGTDEILKVTSKTSNYLTNFSITAYNGNNYTDFISLLVLNISGTITPVSQIASFLDITLGYNSSRQRFTNSYFLNYNTFTIEFADSYASQNVHLSTSKGGLTDTYETSNIKVSLIPTTNNIQLYVESFISNFTTYAGVTASNTYGYVQDYPWIINVSSSLPSGIEEISGTGTGNFVDNFYPSYNTISVGSRYSYAFMTMIVSFILFVIGAFTIRDKHGQGSSTTIFMYLGGLVVGVEFIYFTAIKYIPVMITILIGLVVSFLIFFLFRKTTGV